MQSRKVVLRGAFAKALSTQRHGGQQLQVHASTGAGLVATSGQWTPTLLPKGGGSARLSEQLDASDDKSRLARSDAGAAGSSSSTVCHATARPSAAVPPRSSASARPRSGARGVLDSEHRSSAESGAQEGRRKRGSWNKGLKLSEETRRRMSVSKKGHKVSKATIARMSAAKTGREHDPATIRKISASTRGLPKSEAHRKAISETQRRRHAAKRVLLAVEAAHRELAANNTVGRPIKLASALRASPGQQGRGGDGGAEDLERQYLFQLREFRSLQEELRPWVDAFASKHGRQPTLQDAVDTNVEWIQAKFHQYLVNKQRLMAEIPLMRSQLQVAKDTTDRSRGRLPGRKAAAAVAVSPREASTRMEYAMEYKRRAADAVKSAGSTPAEGAAERRRARVEAQGGAEAAVAGVAAVGKDEAADRGASSAVLASSFAGPDASARVKSALAKALKYKASSGAAADEPSASTPRSAVRLVQVEGKLINGVDYGAVDASSARAGESAFVQSGVPIVSQRKLPADDDDAAPLMAASAPGQPRPPSTDATDASDDHPDDWPPGVKATPLTGPQASASGEGAARLDDEALVAAAEQTKRELMDAVAASRGQFAATMLLVLRSKQAAATAALAHAAATAARATPALHGGGGRRGASAAVLEGDAVAEARAHARQAVQEFELARGLLREYIAQRTGGSSDSLSWV